MDLYISLLSRILLCTLQGGFIAYRVTIYSLKSHFILFEAYLSLMLFHRCLCIEKKGQFVFQTKISSENIPKMILLRTLPGGFIAYRVPIYSLKSHFILFEAYLSLMLFHRCLCIGKKGPFFFQTKISSENIPIMN